MNKIQNKRNIQKQGFTLAETLLAVLILLLVTSVVTAGIPAAKQAYENVVLASNAEVLLSTAITTLQNELGNAKIDGTFDDDTMIKYYNSSRGSDSKIYLDKIDGESEEADDIKTVWVRLYDNGSSGSGKTDRRLVSKEASTEDLFVTYDSVKYDNNKKIITFNNLCVKRESEARKKPKDPNAGMITKRDEFSIRSFY